MYYWIDAFKVPVLFMSLAIWNHHPLLQQPRDLSLYDKAGPYVISLNLDAQSRDKMESDAREFLWSHWHQRRLGHVMVTQYSKEGEPSTSSYFVEPDQKGIWHIAVKIERTLVEREGSKSQHQESVEYKAYLVERIEVPKDGLTARVSIPEGEMRSPQSYLLALKDKTGKALTEI